MFVVKRNQIIITALVVMIGVAGYLNFVDRKQEEAVEPVTLDENGEPVPEELTIYTTDDNPTIAVNSETESTEATTESTEATEVSTETTEGEASSVDETVYVDSSQESSYYTQAKLEREQTYAKEQEVLTSMINDDDVSAEAKDACAKELMDIQEKMEMEQACESMIEAKGFEDVYVRIDDEYIDVVVNKEELTEAEVAQIVDIVTRKTGYSASQIRITPMAE